MIFIGNDIIEIERIKSFIRNHDAKKLTHLFTPSEIDYCNSKAYPCQHFAGRFAAKEAVKKALLSAFPDLVLPLNLIRIENKKNGAPFATIDYDMNGKNINLQISISHSNTDATAIALLEV